MRRQAGTGALPCPVVGSAAIDACTVARIVQRRAAAVGFERAALGGHSLKRGVLTTGMDRGVHPTRLKQLRRHKSYAVLDEYLELGDPIRGTPSQRSAVGSLSNPPRPGTTWRLSPPACSVSDPSQSPPRCRQTLTSGTPLRGGQVNRDPDFCALAADDGWIAVRRTDADWRAAKTGAEPLPCPPPSLYPGSRSYAA